MGEAIRKELRARMPRPSLEPELIVGTGGTITTLAAVAIRRDTGGDGEAPVAAQGYQLRRRQVAEILDELRRLGVEERARVPGLGADRADIIVAGIAIVLGVMEHLGARRLRVHDSGVRGGLLLSMIEEVFPARTAGRADRLAAARRLARSCRYEERHSEHVARLALQIFDAMPAARSEDLWSEPVARQLLEAGAVLHDIGYIVNYAGHHKHAYHLIMHADLTGDAGFTRREVEIVANLARYHRRGGPKMGHPNFAAMSDEDRELVTRLTAILRIADGLDRTHTQNVRALKIRVEGGAAVFEVDAAEDPVTDVWGAARKGALFREAFGLEPRFEWVRQGQSAPIPVHAAT
jgi:exopolyphosphatase/guanosine-5'-triphosphate,3'-diphosphate pyrophosphatase